MPQLETSGLSLHRGRIRGPGYYKRSLYLESLVSYVDRRPTWKISNSQRISEVVAELLS